MRSERKHPFSGMNQERYLRFHRSTLFPELSSAHYGSFQDFFRASALSSIKKLKPGTGKKNFHFSLPTHNLTEPLKNDDTLFEFLVLETFQAGLSWITILRKRENFRKAFDNFDYKKIANYKQEKIDELLDNAGIIRNKLKIHATISNASAYMKIQKEFGSFSDYIWAFVGGKPIKNSFKNYKDAPAKTELSDKISKDLKKRGLKFVGSTVIYATMQAIGMVNDHETNCFRYHEV